MILNKRFDCTFENLDSIVVELAKEIENGWHITKIEHHGFTMHCSTRRNEPEFSIELTRKKYPFKSLKNDDTDDWINNL